MLLPSCRGKATVQGKLQFIILSPNCAFGNGEVLNSHLPAAEFEAPACCGMRGVSTEHRAHLAPISVLPGIALSNM